MARETQADLVKRYDSRARAYREFWAPVLRVPARALLQDIGNHPAEIVLDVGVGVGALVPDIQAAFPAARVVGCDRSPGMLALAPRALPRAVMDAAHLAVRAESVDIVTMAFMLFHLEDPISGLREVARVLRPGGRVGIVTWGGDLDSKAMRTWSSCLDAHGAEPLDAADPAHPELVDTPQKVRALLESAGLRTERARLAEMESRIPLDHLVGLKTGLGKEKVRLDSLEEAVQVACIREARERLALLDDDAFVARGPIVFAVAVKAS